MISGQSLEITMLEKLLHYNNIGSQSQIIYILELLSKGNYSIKDLKSACLSKEYSFSSSFDGVICLLQWLEIITDSPLIKLKNKIESEGFVENICMLLFTKLEQEKKLHDFINSNNLIFDKSIYVRNNLIKLHFSSIRNLLINLNIFEKDNLVDNQFIINKQFSKWFVSSVIPLIEKSTIKNNPLENLKNLKQRQEELGREAEVFVLRYEKEKRSNHLKCSSIQIISETDVTAGYDIQSYLTDSSILLDKFIEVKSYSEKPYFYWSKNEIKVAKQEQDNYFLYLVNRDEMNEQDYQPLIIQNPHKNILNNGNWKKDCQAWKFEIVEQTS